MQRVLVVVAVLAAVLVPSAAVARPAATEPPHPEPNAFGPVLPSARCVPQAGNDYEKALFKQDGWKGPTYERYAGACTRLKFAFGPIVVKPGQNDVLIQPITVEKPEYDGYITRFRPDLVREDGTVPPIEQVHLHHGTWISEPTYGSGPFFAAGEEKTIADFPHGYGLPVKATDQWQLLYMVHSAIPQPTVVYITYEIDYIAKAVGDRIGIKPAYPVWLDVRPSTYPVFNVQRGYGGEGTCTWPRQSCAGFDPFGKAIVGQGLPGDGSGRDWRFPREGGALGAIAHFRGGTLIGIGGHLHPGGISNDIDLVRGSRSQRIYTGVANYWSRTDPSRVGGPPTSWDFSMSVTGLPRWGVRVKPGDILRSNATYDTTIQSTYEDMGIAVALIAPDRPDGSHTASGVDPFHAPFDGSPTCRSGGLAHGVLCDKGMITHGHLAEAGNFGHAAGAITRRLAPNVNEIAIAGFTYAQSDLSQVGATGVPTVKVGDKLEFVNADAAAGIYHTITSCSYPCTGPTGIAFPVADGRTSNGSKVDFDSAELGFGLPIGAAKNAADWTVDVTPQNGFTPGSVVTYFCRVHPFMRGAVAVQG